MEIDVICEIFSFQTVTCSVAGAAEEVEEVEEEVEVVEEEARGGGSGPWVTG